MAEKEIMCKVFSRENTDASLFTIVDNLKNVIKAAASNKYGHTNMIQKFSMDNYMSEMQKVKEAVLLYCQKFANVGDIKTKTDVAMAFDNKNFTTMFNSIVVSALRGVMVEAVSPQLNALCNIVTVEVGDSYTWDIDTKGLPIAQRGTYNDNVAILRGYASSSITISPKVYCIGTTLDYIRILANDYDFGAELARGVMGMLYAQYKLVVNTFFTAANILDTALVSAAWNSNSFVQLASDIKALNGGAGVTAYGTLVAFNKIAALATTGGYGFVSQDEIIRNGYLGKIFGVDCVVLDQATDYSAPFLTATAASLRLIPDNYIVLLSTVGDKPIKLVRENYIRVRMIEAQDNSLNRIEYNYFQSFDAGYATQAHYGLQATA